MLGRSLAAVRPEDRITILGPEAPPQGILLNLNVEVESYIMKILWSLVYALLDSLHLGIKVTKALFNTVIGLPIISLVISLVWFLNYIPNSRENVPT